MTEYDPLFSSSRAGADDLEPVRERFRAASRPFLQNPISWFVWSALLPGAALATPVAMRLAGPSGVLFTWSGVILLGGLIEFLGIRGRSIPTGTLAAWVLRLQGNLSLIALALSVLLVWQDLAWALPGLWLLLLGHSFYMLGGLAFEPMRTCGLIYQIGGVAALWPDGFPLEIFALATAAGNLWMGLAIWRERRQAGPSPG